MYLYLYIYIYYSMFVCMRVILISNIYMQKYMYFFIPRGRVETRWCVLFDGSDKPHDWHNRTKVHLNKRNISQPERMIQFEFPYIKYAYTCIRVCVLKNNPRHSSHPSNLYLWTCWGVCHRLAKGVIDTDLRLNPNRIDYISHGPGIMSSSWWTCFWRVRVPQT